MINWQTLRILIVEDDPAMLEILCDVFAMKKAIVFKAVNGKEALKVLESEAVDIVLSDVQMPLMTGIELLKNIRTKDPRIPIVLLATGEAQVREGDIKSMGGAGLIYKPFKSSQLIQVVTQLFS